MTELLEELMRRAATGPRNEALTSGEIFVWADEVGEIRASLAAAERRAEALEQAVWDALAPYIASEDTEYGEDEMAYLCESILPGLWQTVCDLRRAEAARPAERPAGAGEEQGDG